MGYKSRGGRRFSGIPASSFYGVHSALNALSGKKGHAGGSSGRGGKRQRQSNKSKRKFGHAPYLLTKRQKVDPDKQTSYVAGGKDKIMMRFGGKSIPKYMKVTSATQTMFGNEAFAAYANTNTAAWTGTEFMARKDIEKIWYVTKQQRQADAGGTLPNLTDGGFTNLKCYLMGGSIEYKLINSSVHPLTVHVYDCKVKRDCRNSPITMFITDGTDLGANRNTAMPSDAALVLSSNLNTKLYDAPNIGKHYSVIKERLITLAPGETHTHSVYCTWNKLLPTSLSYYTDVVNATPDNYFRGYTAVTLFKVSGFPVADTAAPSNIQVSKAELLITAQKRYSFKSLASASKHIEYFDSTQTVTNAGFVNEATQILQQAVGGIVTSTNKEYI